MTPREELDTLLDAAMRRALAEVKERGSHSPFALTLTSAGERWDVDADESEPSDPQSVYGRIIEQVAAAVAAGRCRAVAVARRIELTHTISGRKADAVQVTLDHLADQPVTCTMPYTLRHGSVITAELLATEPVARFFARQQPGH